jgi:methionyl-tRNA formyltransferase/MoaA/NifB/PqqE/SkfB family radical SAM enzyme
MKAVLFGLTGYGNAVYHALRASGVSVPLVFSRTEPGAFPYFDCAQLADEAAANSRVILDVDPGRDAASFNLIKELEPDLIVVASYHHRLNTHVAKLAKRAVNFHPSLLPAYRGASPSNWAIIFGQRETGVTLHKLARHLDAGEILMQRKVAIGSGQTDGQLRERLAMLMAEMTEEYVAALRADAEPAGRPQDETQISVYPKIEKRDAHVRFDQGTDRVVSRIHGVTPFPGPYTDFCGVEFGIRSAVVESSDRYDDEPGRVLSVDDAKKEIVVKTMDGSLRLTLDDELNRLGAIAARNADILLFAGKINPFESKDAVAGAKYDVAMPETEDFERYADFPDMVVVSVAYPCNAHCPNCPYTPGNSELREKYGDMPYIPESLFKKIADECGLAAREGWLPDGVGSMIRITGGGEPMMHPAGMASMIEYAKSVGARVYLNSNGSMFRGDDIDRLLACGTDNIEISVDAADKDTYAIVRRGLDWDKLLKTLRYMIDVRNATRGKTTIEVSVINQDLVKDRIGEIERFWYDWGVDNVIVRKFLTWGSNTHIDPNQSGDPLAYLDREAGLPCPYPFHRLNIDTRGKVEVCGFDIMGRTNMGNVREQSIREIWHGAMFDWWRNKHRTGRGSDIPLCAECPDWKYRSWEHNYRKALKNAAERRNAAWVIEA